MREPLNKESLLPSVLKVIEDSQVEWKKLCINSPEDISSIYVLLDPNTNLPRYIGKAKNPQRRLVIHISESRCGSPYRKCRWIRKLLKDNKEPQFFVIDQIGEDDINAAEIFYISFFRKAGFDLTNITEGGDGGLTRQKGEKLSESHRLNIKKALNTDEIKKLRSKNALEMWSNQEFREKTLIKIKVANASELRRYKISKTVKALFDDKEFRERNRAQLLLAAKKAVTHQNDNPGCKCRKCKPSRGMPVLQSDIDSNIRCKFKSLAEAARALGMRDYQSIKKACNRQTIYKGFRWSWVS